jgi:hypothetical protein
MGIVTLKNNDYFVISLKNHKNNDYFAARYRPTQKNNDYFVTRYLPPQKSNDYFTNRYCSLKKVMINSLVVNFLYEKVSIICYSLLFHVKSNDNIVNRYFSHTKFVS